MSWRKIPEGQEREWAELFTWLKSEGYVTALDLRNSGVDALAREPQGYTAVGGEQVDSRPDPQKVAELLKRKGALDDAAWLQLRRLGERPLKSPSALLKVLRENSFAFMPTKD